MKLQDARRTTRAVLILIMLAGLPGPTESKPGEMAAGIPKLNAKVLGTTVQAPGVFSVYLQFSNTGDGDAQNLRVNQVVLRTLSGSGTITLASPAMPLSLGTLNIGGSTSVLLILNVPSTVTRFSLTENGTLQDIAGTNLSFSIAQSFLPGSPTNRPPVAGNDAAHTTPDIPVDIAVMANDSDPNGHPLSVSAFTQPANGIVSFSGGTARYAPNTGFSGRDQFSYTIADGLGGIATAIVSVRVNRPPTVTLSAAPSSGIAPLNVTLTATASDPEGDALVYTWEFGDGGTTPGPASIVHAYQAPGNYTAKVTASDGLASAQASAIVAANASVPLPPDPATVAPPLDPTVVTSMADANAFLYSGSNPIQTAVAPAAIEPQRAAVVRGKVITRDGPALPGVRITILSHPEFGQTMSRADGIFDMAVNGGGPLTVKYEKTGFLPAQRQIDVPWEDFALAPDVALIPYDTQGTFIDLSTAPVPGGPLAPTQIARANPVTDLHGQRQATLLFPQGVTARKVNPDGSTAPLPQLTVRATEYTVGPNGSEAMPAGLPPTSAYTYAVELSVDEAVAKVEGKDVLFSQPVPFYVENFLNFPVGITVPVGYYNNTRGSWVRSQNGRVIRIVGFSNGMAELDTNGDGAADAAGALTALSITDIERGQLAGLYTAGQSLWRVPLMHFSTWDLNWGARPPDDAVALDQDPESDKPRDKDCKAQGSIIECQNQILGEALGVVGTPFGLHYQSERVPGRKAAYTIEIPLSGGLVPASLRRIELEVLIAGRRFLGEFLPLPNQRTTFTWDGKDAYKRSVQGGQPVTARIGYVYPAVYGETLGFAEASAQQITGSPARQEFTFWRTWQDRIDTWDARSAGLGGWTLSPHHAYVPAVLKLFRGDGQRETAQTLGATMATVAGIGVVGPIGDGGPATQAAVLQPDGLAFSADGTMYIVSRACCPSGSTGVVRRVTPGGIITTIAGNGAFCVTAGCGDGGPATQAQLQGPAGVAVGPDNSVYIVESGGHRVRRVDPNGIVTTVAGTGVAGFNGDGGPAHLAQINGPRGAAFGPDGSLYIAETVGRRVRRVDPDGIITTVAGPGSGFSGDGGPATLAGLTSPHGVAVGRDGSLYIAGGLRIRRVTPDGIIRTIAGTGVSGFAGDGGPATAARFRDPTAVAVGPDDTVYVADRGDNRIRWFRPGGVIETLAGTGVLATTGDGGLAVHASVQGLEGGLAVGPDRGIYFSQTFTNMRVRRIAPAFEHFVAGQIIVPSMDGTEVYHFTQAGRHLRTLDAVTGALRYQFAYDGAGRLISLTDADGNVTTIERDSAGSPAAIVGPFGQRTTMAVNADGFLSRVTTPAGEAAQIDYTADGLLTSLTNPRGQTSRYVHDAMGRLTRATDPAGATKTLTRAGTNNFYTVTLTSPLDRTTTYRVERFPNEIHRLTIIDPAGNPFQAVTRKDGSETATYPDGTRIDLQLGPDPRWGMRAPFAAKLTETTPGGKVFTTTSQRTVTLDPADPLSLRTLTETVTINGRVFTSAYDAASRTFTETSPAGRRIIAVEDDRGRLVQEQFGDLSVSTYGYDSRGRLATATEGQGAGSRVVRLGYGADGFLASVTDPINRTATFTTDANGRLTVQTMPDGRTVRFAYDANGNVTSLTPPGRPDHLFAYTQNDQTSAYAAPPVGAESNQTLASYNADRQPLQVNRPDGQSAAVQYDSAGRPSLVDVAVGDMLYGYDAVGRVATVNRDQGANLAYAYDGGLPVSTTWTGAVVGSVSRVYDNNFRVTSLSVNGSNPIALTYDPDSLPVQVGALTLTRNAQNGLVTGTTLGTVSDTMTYDLFGDPATYTATQNGSAVYSTTFTRDALGRIAAKSETIGGVTHTFAYTYDLAGRLTEVRQDGILTSSYSYDTNGNRLSRTDGGGTTNATYDAQDRLEQFGSTTYLHNAAGERQSKTVAGQTTSYRYDTAGNLTGVTLPGATQIVEYLLDGQSRRVGKKVNGTLVQGFLYQDGLKPIAELDGSNNVVSRFVYSTGVNVAAYMIKAGVTYSILTDHLGSPRLVIDAATGSVAQRLDYDEFGEVILDTNPGFQPFGFAGGLYDQLTGLVQSGARAYEAGIGRWITKDRIGFRGGDANLYGYVSNDPVNWIDPRGMAPRTPHSRTGQSKGNKTSTSKDNYSYDELKAALTELLVEKAAETVAAKAASSGGTVAACAVAAVGGLLLGHGINKATGLSDKMSDLGAEGKRWAESEGADSAQAWGFGLVTTFSPALGLLFR